MNKVHHTQALLLLTVNQFLENLALNVNPQEAIKSISINIFIQRMLLNELTVSFTEFHN